MLPTDTMLTNQKCVAVGRLLPLALLVVLAACTPPGPRALLDGERLLNEGKFNEAIAPLTEATVLLPRNARRGTIWASPTTTRAVPMKPSAPITRLWTWT